MQWERLVHFLLAAFATWRISYLLVREEGPGRIFARLRQRTAETSVGRGLTCVKCVSLWAAIPFAFYVGGTATELVVVWLALSGVVSLIDESTRPPFEWREMQADE